MIILINIMITRLYSRARASVYMTKLKELSSNVREEAKVVRSSNNNSDNKDSNVNVDISAINDTFTDTFTDTII